MERFDLKLNGKIAMVSGGSRPGGISQRVIEALVYEGVSVGFADIDPRGKDLETRLRSEGGKCLFVQSDMRDPKDVEVFIHEILDSYGSPHILVNCAGGAKDCGGPTLRETNLEHLISAFIYNLAPPFNLVKTVFPYMCDVDGDKSCILIGSVNGSIGFLGELSYSTAKQGMEGMMRTLASEYSPYGIRVNLIAPASIPNPNSQTWYERLSDPDTEYHLRRMYPLGRWGTPDDVANAVLFLASPNSSWITGIVLPVDGGLIECGTALNHRDDMRWWLPIENIKENTAKYHQ